MLRWVFGADTGPFRKGLATMRNDVKAFGGSITGMLAGAFTFGAITAGLKKALASASDLEEAVSKAGTVFGDQSGEVEEWSEGLAKSFGQAQSKALEAAASFGAVFKVMGIGEEDAARMSQRLVELASDMASFHNSSPEEAIAAIGAGLRGESEPLRRFAVLLDDATLKQEAMAQGIYNGSGSLDVMTRMTAAYNVILRQTSAIQGDFAKNADQAANSERVVAAQAENASAALGTKLLPQYRKLLDLIKNTDVGPVAEGIGLVLSGLVKFVRSVTMVIGTAIGASINQWRDGLSNFANGFSGLKDAIQGVFTLDGSKIEQGAKRYKDAWKGAVDDFKRNYAVGLQSMEDDLKKIWKESPGEKPKTSSPEEAERQRLSIEAAKQKKKLEEEIAKLEQEAAEKRLTIEEKIAKLKKDQKDAAAGNIIGGGNAALEARKKELEIAKEIAALEKQRSDEAAKESSALAALSEQLAAAAQREAEVDKENRRAAMTDEEKLADLKKEQADLMRQSEEARKAGQHLEAIQKRTEAKGMSGAISDLEKETNKPRVPSIVADDMRRWGGSSRYAQVYDPSKGVESRVDTTNEILREIDNKLPKRGSAAPGGGNPF